MSGNARCKAAAAGAVVAFAGAASAQNDPLFQIDVQPSGSPVFQAEGSPAWDAFEPGFIPAGESFTETFNGIDVTLTPTLGPDNGDTFTTNLDNRDRFLSEDDFGGDAFFQDVFNDFVFIGRNTAIGLGHNSLKLDLGGLDPSSVVRVRVYNSEPLNAGDTSFMAYSAVDPGGFSNYQPLDVDFEDTEDIDESGLYKNPVPTLQRGRMSGPSSADPAVNDPFAFTTTFTLPVDADGNTSFYGWADGLSFSNTQLVSLINGLEVFTQLRGDMNFDDVVDENDADLFNAVVAGDKPTLTGLEDDAVLGVLNENINTQALGFDAAADMNGDGVLDQADVDLFNALVGGGGLVGDINNDGFVGAGDLDVLLGVWNQTLADSVADLNDDGFIGAGDLDILLGNWNAGTPPSGSAGVAPEPASLALMSLGVVAVLRRRR